MVRIPRSRGVQTDVVVHKAERVLETAVIGTRQLRLSYSTHDETFRCAWWIKVPPSIKLWDDPHGCTVIGRRERLHEFRDVVLHTKYKNNFDYNYSIFVLNKVPYLANGCIILTENKAIASHIAGLYYETYSDRAALDKELAARKEEIQCAVSHHPVSEVPTFGFGQAQQPALSDYADGVDTMAFLQKLN